MMKALSIRPDAALDIMLGQKVEEYRTWSTPYRGDLLICNTAKKIHGTVPGYALCVAKIYDVIERHDADGKYYAWKIAPFTKGGSYWIEPIKVKGQLKLFNVNDRLIHPAPFSRIDSKAAAKWLVEKVEPLVY
ncbi:MAG TPA: ASCH domain-containing protein [Limosilactobacillus coleohominis]|nr:ASCH domain-containing protein [Limosilactobacillus coleohominis]